MTVGQDGVLGAGSGFQLHHHVGDVVIVAREASQEVQAEGARGPLHIHRDPVQAVALSFDPADLLQQVANRLDFILGTPRGPGADRRYVFKVIPASKEDKDGDDSLATYSTRAPLLPRTPVFLPLH